MRSGSVAAGQQGGVLRGRQGDIAVSRQVDVFSGLNGGALEEDIAVDAAAVSGDFYFIPGGQAAAPSVMRYFCAESGGSWRGLWTGCR